MMEVGPSAAPMTAMEAASFVEIEEDRGQAQRKEDAELRCCAEDHQLRIGKQRPEVYHRADADEQDQREQLVVNASFEQRNQRAARLHGVHTRNVDQDRAEADGQQQRGLHILGNRQINQQSADAPHDDLLPGHGQNVLKQHQKVHS